MRLPRHFAPRNDKKDSVSTLGRSISLLNILSQNNLCPESLMGCERCGLGVARELLSRVYALNHPPHFRLDRHERIDVLSEKRFQIIGRFHIQRVHHRHQHPILRPA